MKKKSKVSLPIKCPERGIMVALSPIKPASECEEAAGLLAEGYKAMAEDAIESTLRASGKRRPAIEAAMKEIERKAKMGEDGL